MTVDFHVSGSVARITLSVPGAGNLIDFATAYSLHDFITQVRQREDIRVLIVDSDGPDFCRGTEPAALIRAAEDETQLRTLRVAQSVAEVEKPVVCAIRGDAHDQGLELALACDLRIADPSATFAIRHALSDRMPWDGGTQRLPRLIGRSRATEMLLTGRELNAHAALEIGLVNELAESGSVERRAAELAETIAQHAPIAVRYLKEAVLTGTETSLVQGLRLEADLSFLLQSTRDRSEGISSFLERRTPDFRGH